MCTELEILYLLPQGRSTFLHKGYSDLISPTISHFVSRLRNARNNGGTNSSEFQVMLYMLCII